MIPQVLCSMEMVPGWGIFELGWPEAVYYAIMVVAGAVGGLLMAERHRFAGLVGGAIAGPGSIFAVALHLGSTDETWNFICVLLAAIGALPGIGVYWVLRLLQDALLPNNHGQAPPPHNGPSMYDDGESRL
ncbi:MAG: hypothetical protein RIC55_24030 [Pirellulaceae bacterium]